MSSSTTRIAPSPTGMFHLGTARTALFNYLAARSTGGYFILRIDDTDVARNSAEAEQVIFDALDWLGLTPDAVYRQSQRIDLYRSRMGLLAQAGKVRVIEDGDFAGVTCLNMPDHMPSIWRDTILGDVPITDSDRKQIVQLALLRSDGTPTYHFASIVDDLCLGVTHVIRGSDHANNTPKQLAILHALVEAGAVPDVPDIHFTHLGLIMVKDADGKRKKLSKRDDAASLLHFRDAGVPASAMVQFLLRLGWSASDPNFDRVHKIVTLDQAVDLFGEGRMGNTPVLFDQDKLNHLNRLHNRTFQQSPFQ